MTFYKLTCLKSIEKRKKLKNKKKILTFVVVILAMQVYGQAVPPPIPPPPPPGLPIDGGAIFLLLSGVVYGVKKIISKN